MPALKASRNSGSRLSSSTLARINPGLQRLAKFMEQAKAYEASSSHSPSSSSPDSFSSTSTTQPTPAANTSAPPHNPRSEEDALILDNGVPHFVSGKHWAWMAAELQDIQSVLTESQKSSSPEGTLDDVIWEADSPAKASFSNISNNFWPDTREDCYLLLNVYLANVDPIVRIIHRPSLARRFDAFVRSQYPDSRDYTPTQGGDSNGGTSCGPTKIDAFQPLVMSIFYAAVNSIKDTDVATMFGMDKVSLLNRYRMGTEMLLKRQKFMTSRIFEVLQAFVILLTAQYREDDMGKVWPLTGLAIRIAMLQGLHRDPLALPLGTIDVVQVELRRRLWAQICYLDFRTAEDHGFAPSIHASDFDTRRPVSLDDVDLIEGVAPLAGLSDASKFTDMTIYLLRITAAGYYGHIIQITHASRKRLRNGLNGSVIDESQSLVKLQELLQTATGLADPTTESRENYKSCYETKSRISEAWMEDLRQRGLQLANAIYDLRGHHTTGAWPAIMWLVNRIRFQQDPAEDSRPLMAAGAVVGGNGGTGPGGPSDTQPSIMRPAGPAGAGGVDDAPPVGPAGLEFDTGDLMGLIDLEDFDFSDFIVMDGMGLPGLSR
nr:hypothetical protein ANI_1_2310074 [Aspergillus niger CBS 513.88]|eukprot:XP_001393035.2 hypothetical protein ANI_1_2310074 [Aspergillus niger CBS 513.88]